MFLGCMDVHLQKHRSASIPPFHSLRVSSLPDKCTDLPSSVRLCIFYRIVSSIFRWTTQNQSHRCKLRCPYKSHARMKSHSSDDLLSPVFRGTHDSSSIFQSYRDIRKCLVKRNQHVDIQGHKSVDTLPASLSHNSHDTRNFRERRNHRLSSLCKLGRTWNSKHLCIPRNTRIGCALHTSHWCIRTFLPWTSKLARKCHRPSCSQACRSICQAPCMPCCHHKAGRILPNTESRQMRSILDCTDTFRHQYSDRSRKDFCTPECTSLQSSKIHNNTLWSFHCKCSASVANNYRWRLSVWEILMAYQSKCNWTIKLLTYCTIFSQIPNSAPWIWITSEKKRTPDAQNTSSNDIIAFFNCRCAS